MKKQLFIPLRHTCSLMPEPWSQRPNLNHYQCPPQNRMWSQAREQERLSDELFSLAQLPALAKDCLASRQMVPQATAIDDPSCQFTYRPEQRTDRLDTLIQRAMSGTNQSDRGDTVAIMSLGFSRLLFALYRPSPSAMPYLLGLFTLIGLLCLLLSALFAVLMR